MSSLAGFLNVLKPPGMTSHDVVGQVRFRLPGRPKVGHLGTLDPAASGVLPVAVGAATRLIPLLPDYGPTMKGYLAELALGVATQSDDLEGEVLERSPLGELEGWPVSRWQEELSRFEGEIWQIPPQVSAVRKDGQRAYEAARQGKTLELAARRVQIARCQARAWCPDRGRLQLYLLCSSGTYVRSLARDLGQRLGVGGALAFLIRTQSGPFSLTQSLTLEELWQRGVGACLWPEQAPFLELPRLDERVPHKGALLRAAVQPGQRYLATNGLVLGLEKPGEGRVEAVFQEGRA